MFRALLQFEERAFDFSDDLFGCLADRVRVFRGCMVWINYYVLIMMKYSISNSILNSVALKKKHPDSLGIQVLSFSFLPYTLAAAATSAA